MRKHCTYKGSDANRDVRVVGFVSLYFLYTVTPGYFWVRTAVTPLPSVSSG